MAEGVGGRRRVDIPAAGATAGAIVGGPGEQPEQPDDAEPVGP
jgi:hypothetical protein